LPSNGRVSFSPVCYGARGDLTAGAVNEPVGGPVPRQAWSIRTITGELIYEEGDLLGPGQSRKPYEYFMAMFPMTQLVLMVRLTSDKFETRGMRPTTAGDLLKFIGVTALVTRYEISARADLWATIACSKYMLATAFGLRTGMPRARFDALWSSVAFSKQVVDGGDSEESRWQLIDDFVSNINLHRSARVTPSDIICVEEPMSKWYGQGSHWILKGLPMYVAIDRKPDNGCEVQNAACGRSGLMLRLSIVTTAEHRQGAATTEDGDLPHGTIVLKHLVAPWADTERMVWADSYFASETAARQLLGMGLHFIGVVKTATRGYPIVGGSAIALLWMLSGDLGATQCGAPTKPQPTTWNGRSGIWRHNYSVQMA